jgi:dihydroxyacetone kinase-like protein
VEEKVTPPALTSADLVSVLNQVSDDLEGHSEELRQLDAVIGDGDLGITTQLGSKAMREYLASANESNIGQMLARCGMSINKASPSTFGTLLASAFMGAGKAVSGKESLDTGDLIAMADGAIDGIQKRGKAELGDKTMLDCLVPAVEAFKGETTKGSDLKKALEAAVAASEQGLKATVNMVSKHGRASWHREKTVGVQDAGATALYYMIESFARHLQE